LEQRQFHVPGAILLDAYRNVDVDSVEAVNATVTAAGRDFGFVTLQSDSFAQAKAISIDYSRDGEDLLCGGRSRCVRLVGCRILARRVDSQGNAAQGMAVFEDTRNCNVSTDKAMVALEGVDDLVVVATQDAVLVSRQKDANGLKRLVAKLKTVAPQGTEDHLYVHRPWGSYQSVDMGDRHQVKRIVVKPGGRLSLQKHHHRSEHWIVVITDSFADIAGTGSDPRTRSSQSLL
jgi:mannose-1-phosphate guanylyltransferase / mannose-6-phosphate isomerase